MSILDAHQKHQQKSFPFPPQNRAGFMTRWWQTQIFFMFTPKIGEDEPNLTVRIFFRWVGWFNHQLVDQVRQDCIASKEHKRKMSSQPTFQRHSLAIKAWEGFVTLCLLFFCQNGEKKRHQMYSDIIKTHQDNIIYGKPVFF